MDAWTKVIAAASTSPLGILALIILVLMAVATQFFGQAQTGVKVVIFLLLFLAACAYGYTVVNTGHSTLTTSRVASLAATKADGTAATAAGPARDPCNVLPDSSTRLIGAPELASLDKSALKLARNEIFARHGYAFQTKDMQDNFAKCSWYARSDAPVVLSRTEAENVKAIQNAERAR